MKINEIIAGELQVAVWQVEAAVNLIDEGNTIPFIARYRKEATGTLDDEQLRHLGERLTYLRHLDETKEKVRTVIEEQGKMTPKLLKAIEEASTQVALEDIYRPYRPKRRTRATIAKEKGLEALADVVLLQRPGLRLHDEAQKYVNEETDKDKAVPTVEDALSGASDIIAEKISDEAGYRTWIREKTGRLGLLCAEAKKEEEESVYENYYHFSGNIKQVQGFRILAINRGEKEKYLKVRIEAPREEILSYLNRNIIKGKEREVTAFLEAAVTDSYDRLIAPAIEREIRNELTERAEDGAIDVFGKNLEQLLLTPPIPGQVVLGWDPAFRTGCKLAVVDATGKVLDTAVVYPTAPTNDQKIKAAKDKVKDLIGKYHISLISLGNGTASRESEKIIAEIIKEVPEKVSYVITNEAGASVYSASALATKEFPEFDVGQRSAASIGRRLQDPLAELVKIEPKSIGVGQYQHDMNQKKLEEKLSGVVEHAVNSVGVDLNTASAPLLEYVSGISKTVATNIVAMREEKGAFQRRRDLLKVPKLGAKAYEQCAGFLRIFGGSEPLDGTGVHPESYEATRALMQELKVDPKTLFEGHTDLRVSNTRKTAETLGIGEETLKDILQELAKPGRDIREEMPKPILKQDVLELTDLKEGMILKGTVRNIVDFGAFVDLGVHADGLVHISQMARGFVKHPLDVVSVGDVVEVKVVEIDRQRKRISLSMIFD